MRSTCGWNPMSSIRSASSSTKIFTPSSLTSLRSARSCSRPGVAIRMCASPTPFDCSVTRVPPYTTLVFRCLARAMSTRSSFTCCASSRVGTRINAAGCFVSSGESCSTIGMANPSVLPEPVCDLASVSRPDVASWITITWIGKGSWMPRLARVSITASDTPRSLKDVMDDAEDGSMHDERTPRGAGDTVPRLGGRLAGPCRTRANGSHGWTIGLSSGTTSRRSSPSTASDARRQRARDTPRPRCPPPTSSRSCTPTTCARTSPSRPTSRTTGSCSRRATPPPSCTRR